MNDTILEVKDLSVTFTQYDRGFSRRTIHAVEKMDLSVRAGEIVAVVGSSGSGKSLLAHAIMGILPYNSAMDGEIRFLGTPLTAERVKKLRGHEIVFVPQSVSYLDPLMKIGDQIQNGKKDVSVKEKCLAVLKRYGLAPDIRGKYPFQLSGGMAQRVTIALAACSRARLLIADEPTTALDVTIQEQILQLIRELNEKLGMSVLFITHDMGAVANLCHNVKVMYLGQVVEEASTEELFQNPLHPYTQGLLSCIPHLGVKKGEPLPVIEGSVPPLSKVPVGCHFCTRCKMADQHCMEHEPPACEVAPGHVVKCWKYAESGKQEV